VFNVPRIFLGEEHPSRSDESSEEIKLTLIDIYILHPDAS
jgi:hypothetical protein